MTTTPTRPASDDSSRPYDPYSPEALKQRVDDLEALVAELGSRIVDAGLPIGRPVTGLRGHGPLMQLGGLLRDRGVTMKWNARACFVEGQTVHIGDDRKWAAKTNIPAGRPAPDTINGFDLWEIVPLSST